LYKLRFGNYFSKDDNRREQCGERSARLFWQFFSRKWLGLLAVCSSTPLPIPAKFESNRVEMAQSCRHRPACLLEDGAAGSIFGPLKSNMTDILHFNK